VTAADVAGAGPLDADSFGGVAGVKRRPRLVEVPSRSRWMLRLAAGLAGIAAVLFLVDALSSGGVVSWLGFGFCVLATCFFAALGAGRLGKRADTGVDDPGGG
jgi:hypothetical protein